MKKYPLGREEGGESKIPPTAISTQIPNHETAKEKKSTQENNTVKKIRQEKLREVETVSQPGFHKPR